MKNLQYKNIAILLLAFLFSPILCAENNATILFSDEAGNKKWTLDNDILTFEIVFSADGKIIPKTFYNKEADVNYMGDGSLLFSYAGQYIPVKSNSDPSTLFDHKSIDAGWEYKTHTIETIRLSEANSAPIIGEHLNISISKENIEIRLSFEIFAGRAGLRYQAFIKNTNEQAKMLIEKSDVISFNLPLKAHNLHYVTNAKWQSTKMKVEESVINNKGKDVAKCFLNLYVSNDGWYIAPEVNWKTQYGPEVSNNVGSPKYDYMLRSFAELTAWAGNSDFVKVSTCPEAFQLVLFPNEEFEYIAVNLTAFKGDIVDGKMAVEEHLRKRFRYHHTTTSFVVNDWEWFRNGLRTKEYYNSVVIPQARKAGYEMIMFDDGWNNATADGKWINNVGLSRDPVEASPHVISDMISFSNSIVNAGFQFGLWYSMSGGYHNNGNDLADQTIIDAKKDKLSYMIDNYKITHQAVDLTQYWQNQDETPYSHPSDNVYRKNVLTRNMMNDIVSDNPEYQLKVTSELDIFPSQGDRSTELIHLPYNGWMTITAARRAIDSPGIHFGHLPLNACYGGGNPVKNMDTYYSFLSVRNVKVDKQPDQWDAEGVKLMGQFSAWRRGDRIKALTDNIMRPVYWGLNWDKPDATQWKPDTGPYLWMYTSDNKENAILFATGGGKRDIAEARYPLRWLDPSKSYLVQDISLDDSGIFTFNYKGKYVGETLNISGLKLNLNENTSSGKAFWIVEAKDSQMQVIYADENIKTYTEDLSGGKLIITAEGTPNSFATIIIYGKSEDNTMTASIAMNAEGKGKIEIKSITPNAILYPGLSLR